MHIHPFAIELATDHQRSLVAATSRHRLATAARNAHHRTRTHRSHPSRIDGTRTEGDHR